MLDGLALVHGLQVDLHRCRTSPAHDKPKPFQKLCFNRTVSLSLLAQVRDRARDAQMPKVMGGKLHLLLFFELLLRRSKELVPMIVEGRTAIRFSSPGQK